MESSNETIGKLPELQSWQVASHFAMIERLVAKIPPSLKQLIGTGKPIDAIIRRIHIKRMLIIYGRAGGWKVSFFLDAAQYLAMSKRLAIVLTDDLATVAQLREAGGTYPPIYLVGPDSDELAETAEHWGIKALLTCPDAWFSEA